MKASKKGFKEFSSIETRFATKKKASRGLNKKCFSVECDRLAIFHFPASKLVHSETVRKILKFKKSEMKNFLHTFRNDSILVDAMGDRFYFNNNFFLDKFPFT